MSVADFKKQIEKAIKNTEGKFRKVVAETSLTLQATAVELAPIGPDEWNDEPREPGTLKNSIRIGINNYAIGIPPPDITGSGALAQGKGTISAYKVGDSVFISTNVPYARLVEFGEYKNIKNRQRTTPAGFSTQAPAGVFTVAKVEFKRLVEDAVKGIK